MVLVGNDFYVADTDAIVKFPYHEGDTKITAPGVKLADLPAGPINHHWTKDLTASPDGTKLYATVGSNSNVGENGMEAEKDRAAVLEDRSRQRQMARIRLGPAQSERACPGSRKAARSGSPSTSATNSATIWCPTT